MRVFVAGASGALGSRLVPQLIDAGHEVIGTHNAPASAELLRTLGAKPVMLDLLDAGAVRKAVLESEPEGIVHQATALANLKVSRNVDKVFAKTNQLRSKGTDALLAAGRVAGVRRFVAQSNANLRYARDGGPVKTEDDPLDTKPVAGAVEVKAALNHLDDAVVAAGGIALRYGIFYGAANDGLVEPVRKRQFPIIGDGGGITSFIHLDDAAAATVLALERDGPALYNIVDDDPAPAREWLPALAQALHVKPPWRFPTWLARLVAGEALVVFGVPGTGALVFHALNGGVVLLSALALLIIAFFAKIPQGVRWAVIVLVCTVVQIALGTLSHLFAVIGAVHGVVALALFGVAVRAAMRARTPAAVPEQPVPAKVA